MAFQTTTAFAAGVATGWVLRGVLGSSREAIVRVVVIAHRGQERVKRVVAENAEWLDDLFAEGRSRYEDARDPAGFDGEDAPPPVVPTSGERAA